MMVDYNYEAPAYQELRLIADDLKAQAEKNEGVDKAIFRFECDEKPLSFA